MMVAGQQHIQWKKFLSLIVFQFTQLIVLIVCSCRYQFNCVNTKHRSNDSLVISIPGLRCCHSIDQAAFNGVVSSIIERCVMLYQGCWTAAGVLLQSPWTPDTVSLNISTLLLLSLYLGSTWHHPAATLHLCSLHAYQPRIIYTGW